MHYYILHFVKTQRFSRLLSLTQQPLTLPPPPSLTFVAKGFYQDSIRADFDKSLSCFTIPFEVPFFSSLVHAA